jgi:hypothetical protein
MTTTFLWLYKNHTEKTPLVKHEIKKTKAEFSITTIRRVQNKKYVAWNYQSQNKK